MASTLWGKLGSEGPASVAGMEESKTKHDIDQDCVIQKISKKNNFPDPPNHQPKPPDKPNWNFIVATCKEIWFVNFKC